MHLFKGRDYLSLYKVDMFNALSVNEIFVHTI